MTIVNDLVEHKCDNLNKLSSLHSDFPSPVGDDEVQQNEAVDRALFDESYEKLSSNFEGELMLSDFSEKFILATRTTQEFYEIYLLIQEHKGTHRRSRSVQAALGIIGRRRLRI
jgi:hypothetical protein